MWLDYTLQVVEQQQIAIMPTNDDSCTIGYDQRFLFGDKKRYPPLAYKISKVNPSLSGAITTFTMTQEQFSASLDNADEMIGGYYISTISPKLPDFAEIPTLTDLIITYSGSPSVRAGGSYKKLTLKTRIDDVLTDVVGEVEWTVSFDGNENKLEYTAQDNVFKVKCINDYSLIGQTFVVTAKMENQSTSMVMEVASL